MELIADAASFSSDNRFNGFMLLSLLSTPLFIISFYLLISPPELFADAKPAALAFVIGSFFVLLLLCLFLKTRGLIFKVPLRIYDGGILIQSTAHIRPKLVRWQDLTSLELWEGLSYMKTKGGSIALTSEGEVKTVELFKDKEALKTFVKTVRPVMEGHGLKMAAEDEGGSHYSATFRRSIVPVRL
ncbi:MAG: hypothetical protein AB1295_00615 [Candidatus Micrarchaeota archaeon]